MIGGEEGGMLRRRRRGGYLLWCDTLYKQSLSLPQKYGRFRRNYISHIFHKLSHECTLMTMGIKFRDGIYFLIRYITNVWCIAALQSSIYFFLSPGSSSLISVSYLLSSLSAVFLLLFSSLSLSSSWLGEITPPHRDTLSSLARWWNAGNQSNAASLVVEITSWGSAFICFYWSCTALIHPMRPTSLPVIHSILVHIALRCLTYLIPVWKRSNQICWRDYSSHSQWLTK